MKKIIVLLSLFIFLIILAQPNNTYAQYAPTHECAIYPATGVCAPKSTTPCPAGYVQNFSACTSQNPCGSSVVSCIVPNMGGGSFISDVCSNFRLDSDGEFNNYINFIVDGCDRDFLYRVQILTDSNSSLAWITMKADGGQMISESIYTLFRTGNYKAILSVYDPSRDSVTPIETINFAVQEPPEGEPSPSLDVSSILTCIATDGEKGLPTALGCLSLSSPITQAANAIYIGLGFGAGVVLIMIAIAAFMISTSQGDPRRLNAGKEILFSSLAGLVLVILATFILRLIGFTILGIF